MFIERHPPHSPEEIVLHSPQGRSCIEPGLDDSDIDYGLTKLTPGLDERALARSKLTGEQFTCRSDDRAGDVAGRACDPGDLSA